MKIERLKKNHKKEILIGAVITLEIVSAITLTTTRAKYKLTQSIKIAEGEVHYKVPDMRIVAINVSEDGTNYNIQNEIPTGNYQLNTDKTACKVATETSEIENAPKDNNVTIEYRDGKINFYGITKKGTRCYLYFDKYTPPITVENIIASTNYKTTTPTFSSAATTDEGVYAASDGMYGGTSYYWRGAATTNHVIFANKCWRIIRINGDKTIRLIYNGTPSGTAPNQTCPENGANSGSIAVTSQAYNSSSDRSEYAGWSYSTGSQRTTSGTASNAKIQTESWYSSNLSSYESKIADGKFCNDRNVGSGYSWSSQPSGSSNTFSYAGYSRAGTYNTTIASPTLNCTNSGDIYTLKVGAITIDEVIMAGCKWNTANNSYYLYNGQYYWTMSPYAWHYMNTVNRYVSVFFVNLNGDFGAWNVSSTDVSLRPVINLRSDTTFQAGGLGTSTKPYVVQ